MLWIYVLTSVLVVSLLSFVGVLALALKKDLLQKILLYMVAFSAGALIGGAFLHLIPHAFEEGQSSVFIALAVMIGFLLFFILEKFLRWRHCHDIDCHAHPKHLGMMNLIGDGFHNFIDGVLIGVSFVASLPLGITTTIAVIAHEVPQELGDFGVLLHSGFSRRRALTLNFLSAATAILGAILAVLIGEKVEGLIDFLIPLTAGGFIYIAASGLIPELHKENNQRKNFVQFIFLILGMAVMYLLIYLE